MSDPEHAAPTPPPERWRCAKCGCRTFAKVDERQDDGSFAPGQTKRCVECKALEAHTPRTTEVGALVERPTTRDEHGNGVQSSVDPGDYLGLAASLKRIAWQHLGGHYTMNGVDALNSATALETLSAQVAGMREALERVNGIAIDRAYMLDATARMLGPKGRQVWEGWQAKGIRRIHVSWGPEAASLDGEQIAQAHMDMDEAARHGVRIDSIDGHIAALSGEDGR